MSGLWLTNKPFAKNLKSLFCERDTKIKYYDSKKFSFWMPIKW